MVVSNKGVRHRHHALLFQLMTYFLLSSSLFLRRRVQTSYDANPRYASSTNTFNLDITLQRCHHPYNPNLFDFYRTNFHDRPSKRNVPSLPKKHDDGADAIYTLKSRHQDEILASLRLTKSKNDNQYTFLRSLCVAREHRRHGLASRLFNESLQHFDARHCYCFASPELGSFYEKLGFTPALESIEEGQSIPKWMINSYESMANRNSHKTLKLYVKYSPSLITSTQNNLTEIVLLQHYTELSKKTATGWLLNDTQYADQFGKIPVNDFIESRMKLTLWKWGGSNDITYVENQINGLKDSNRKVYLLWTGGATADVAKGSGEHDKPAETYIILDGTWQQAKKMYRKISALWSLPKLSLQGMSVPPSTYVLRGDYSGWRKRFSNNDEGDGSDLLCTAEVAAAVIEKCGDATCANVIRTRLDTFQSTFPPKFQGETNTKK